MTDEIKGSSRSRHLSKGDKVEVVKILILAIVSFLAGFALVFLFFRPSTPSADEGGGPASGEELAAMENDEPQEEPESNQGYAPEPAADEGGGYAPAQGEGSDGEQDSPGEGDAPPEVPPGKTPDGVFLDGDAFYLKCWDSDGVEHKGADCDKLGVLEKRFSTRLYVVDKCRVDSAGASASGKLSVASEVDFSRGTVSFWNGASSDVRSASEIGACLRESLSGLPIHSVDHKYSRYRIFFTVLFGDAAKSKEKEITKEEEATAAKVASGKGRLVDVVKDRVRVRKAPVDGDIIGKISTGNQVRFLKKKGEWCNIITPNNNEGWMICNALSL